MKSFEGENYYQILNVPGSATAIEVRRAYLDTLEIYKEDSIATYSLFSSGQREALLQAIGRAFDTLINESKRAAYDRMLIDSGQVDPAFFTGPAAEKPATHSISRGMSREKSLSLWVQKKSENQEIKSLIEQVLSKEMISGQDLKRLRQAMGIDVNEIYTITRISSSILEMIEADRFEELPAEIYLKQFLRSYAEMLQIDPQPVVEGYLRSMGRGNS
jgi:DnaJ-class molecular chaperone